MSQAVTVREHPVVTGVRSAAGCLDQVARPELWQLADAEVEAALAAALEVECRTAAIRAALLREAASRGLQEATRASSPERWLGDRFRLSRADAAARHREAAGLGRHPQVEAALADAVMTPEQAAVAVAVLDRVALLPDVSDDDRAAAGEFLVVQAGSLSPRDLGRAGEALVEALSAAPSVDDPADAEDVRRQHERAEAEALAVERNDLRLVRRRGRLRTLLDLGPVGEATLLAWLRRADRPAPGVDGFDDERSLSERRADALVELLADAAVDRPGADADCHDAASLTDPLDEIDDEARLGRDAAAPPTSRGPVSPMALLTVTTTLEELRAGLTGAGRLDTGRTLSAATLRELACDSLVVPAVLGGAAQVLDLGRATKVWNRAQRRAIALRDRGCVAPGCDRPPHACQVHHCQHWIVGGPTDLANGALLCGFHHRMVHRQGWGITLAANGYPQLIPPTSIDPEQRPRQHHRFTLTVLTGRRRN
jgi:hypothetical protein